MRADDWPSPVSGPGLEAELEHTRLLSDRSAVARHLVECGQCQRELRALTALRKRMSRMAKPAALSHDPAYFFAKLDSVTPAPISVRAQTSRNAPRAQGEPLTRRKLLAFASATSAAAVAALWAVHERGWAASASEGVPPMVDDALLEYERALGRELPAPASPQALSAAVGHAVPYLEHAELSVVSAWLTRIRNEPAAAIAYRFRSNFLVQFVVSEALFFRQPRVRDAIARSGAYQVTSGVRAVVGVARRGAGSLLVGEMNSSLLEHLLPPAD